jgi:hypothetical protein
VVTGRIGQRASIIGAVACILGTLIAVVAHDSVLVVGIAIGVASSVVPIYRSEMSPQHLHRACSPEGMSVVGTSLPVVINCAFT